MKKRMVALSLALCMLLTLVPFASAASFTDIGSHWARESIIAMADAGIVNGYPDGTFRPNETITRAEFLTIVVRRYAPDEAYSAVVPTDVAANAWYNDIIRRALGAGYIPAEMIVGNQLKPDTAITREEAAAVLATALKLPASTKSLTYSDRAAISTWAVEAVARCSENGLFGGYADGGFHPQGNITRAEVSTVLNRVDIPTFTPELPLVLSVTGTENLVVGKDSVLTVTTNETVVRLQVRDSFGNIIGERSAEKPSNVWEITVRPVREGEQNFTFHASVVYGTAFDKVPHLTVPVTVTRKSVPVEPAVTHAQASTTTPKIGDTVTITVTTNTAATCVGIYNASGVRIAETTAYTTSGTERLWTLTYKVDAGASTRVLTICPGDADGYRTALTDRIYKLTLTVKDPAKLPSVVSVKASSEAPKVGDTVTITVTTNKLATRVKLVDALGQTIAEKTKTSDYTTSGDNRVWKFTLKVETAGVSQIYAYAASSSQSYSEDITGTITLTIGEKNPIVRSVTASNYNPRVGDTVVITVTTDSTVRRLKLADGSGNPLATTTSYTTSGGLRVWKFECTILTAGQKNLRIYYGTSANSSVYSDQYSALTLNASSPAVDLSISDVRVTPLRPTVGQPVTATVTTSRAVTRLKIADIFGNSVTELSGGYSDTALGRIWTVSLVPATSGSVQYFVYAGTSSGYTSTPSGFTLDVQPAPYREVPTVNSVTADKVSVSAGDIVTLTITTNAVTESVRLVDQQGSVITSGTNYTMSGTSRIWTLQVRISRNATYVGYVQAAGNGYDYVSTSGKTVTLTAKYSGTPVIYSVSQDNSGAAFGIRKLVVVTSQNVDSVTVSNGASTRTYEDVGVQRIWTVSWTPAKGEATYVTVSAHGDGIASYSIHLS